MNSSVIVDSAMGQIPSTERFSSYTKTPMPKKKRCTHLETNLTDNIPQQGEPKKYNDNSDVPPYSSSTDYP